jgi:hypothetical protein
MRTAGGTLRRRLRSLFGPDELYPTPEHDEMFRANQDLDLLRGLPETRKATIKVYAGHFPFMVRELIEPRPLVLSVVRDPVERTLSLLKLRSQGQRYQGWDLEAIYEDPFLFRWLVHNHQTRVFGLTVEDEPKGFMTKVPIDEDRLAIARRSLEQVDVLGLTDHYERFLDEVIAATGWHLERLPNAHVSKGDWDVSDSFLERIAEDNALDLALYDHALDLVGQPNV